MQCAWFYKTMERLVLFQRTNSGIQFDRCETSQRNVFIAVGKGKKKKKKKRFYCCCKTITHVSILSYYQPVISLYLRYSQGGTLGRLAFQMHLPQTGYQCSPRQWRCVKRTFKCSVSMTTTHASLVSHVLALFPCPEPDRSGSDRISGSKAETSLAFTPSHCVPSLLWHITSSVPALGQLLGSENWTLGTQLDLMGPWKRENSEISSQAGDKHFTLCVTGWVFKDGGLHLRQKHCFPPSTDRLNAKNCLTGKKQDSSTR